MTKNINANRLSIYLEKSGIDKFYFTKYYIDFSTFKVYNKTNEYDMK